MILQVNIIEIMQCIRGKFGFQSGVLWVSMGECGNVSEVVVNVHFQIFLNVHFLESQCPLLWWEVGSEEVGVNGESLELSLSLILGCRVFVVYVGDILQIMENGF